MFGVFRRRPGLQPGHRSTSKVAGWVALAAVLAIVIGEVTADVVDSGGSAPIMQARTFATAVVPLVEESNVLASWLADVHTDPVKLGRAGIESALGRLVTGCSDLQVQLTNLGIPAPSLASSRLISSTFSLRTLAAREVTGGISLATGPTKDAA